MGILFWNGYHSYARAPNESHKSNNRPVKLDSKRCNLNRKKLKDYVQVLIQIEKKNI